MTCDFCGREMNPLFGITRDDKDYFVCNDCWNIRDVVVKIRSEQNEELGKKKEKESSQK